MKKLNILIRPLYTEKIARLQDRDNKYAFEVDRDANKIEIRKEIEKRFLSNENGSSIGQMNGLFRFAMASPTNQS